MILLVFLRFSKIAKGEFSDITSSVEVHEDRLKIYLMARAVMEVRYPVEDKYSFHMKKGHEIYRIDTAPHHPEIPSYPRHIHFKRENVILEDKITSPGNAPEENFREVMRWVRNLLRGSE